jgi:hypothetical protein
MRPALLLPVEDEAAFRSWLIEHPAGLYLNVSRFPASDEVLLHRVWAVLTSEKPSLARWDGRTTKSRFAHEHRRARGVGALGGGQGCAEVPNLRLNALSS